MLEHFNSKVFVRSYELCSSCDNKNLLNYVLNMLNNLEILCAQVLIKDKTDEPFNNRYIFNI